MVFTMVLPLNNYTEILYILWPIDANGGILWFRLSVAGLRGSVLSRCLSFLGRVTQTRVD